MKNSIQIFELSGILRDGGSIKKIVTNIGIFSLCKKLGRTKKYFNNGKAVEEKELIDLLDKGIEEYQNQKTIRYLNNQVDILNEYCKKYGYKELKLEKDDRIR